MTNTSRYHPAQDATDATLTHNKLQFGLKSALVATAVAALFLSLTYHRPITVRATYQLAIVDASAAKRTLAAHAPTAIKDSTYQWVVIDDAALGELLQLGFSMKPVRAERSLTVDSWPYCPSSCTYSTTTPTDVDNIPFMESGTANLFFGASHVGWRRVFRVQGHVDFSHPGFKALAEGGELSPMTSYAADLLYEGPLPVGHLVFVVEIDDAVAHVVIVGAQ